MRNSKKLFQHHPFLFAVDHKVEHLNQDFYGEGIASSANNIENIFTIAHNGNVDALMTHLGLVQQWGTNYPDLNYVIKLNGKTNLVPTSAKDPLSLALWDIDQIVQFREQSRLKIVGVAYTIYLGSEYEHLMMQEAGRITFEAQQAGLPVFIFTYPRGKHVTQKQNHPDLVTGAAGIAASLGADFVKLAMPYKNGAADLETIRIAQEAAGKTQILFAGGSTSNRKDLLQNIQSVCNISQKIGFAVGRNIFQLPLEKAMEQTHNIRNILKKV